MALNKVAMRRQLLQALSRALKELRTEHADVTQEELAEQIGMDRSYWGDIERGERNITLVSLYQLAYGLGVTPLQLFMAVDKQYRALQREPGREAEIARLIALTEELPIMTWISGTNQECLHVNQRILEFTGRSLKEIQGKGWMQNIHPDDVARHMALNAKAFAARKDYRDQYRFRRADGKYLWLAQKAAVQFSSKGEFLGFLGFLTLIDEPEKRQVAPDQQ